jgi:deoxyribonuclease IV
MEIEWVHSVAVSDKDANSMREIQEQTGCALTAHGPYYINLNSKDDKIIEASIKRILLTARKGSQCGCSSFTFHAAFVMKRDRNDVHRDVLQHLTNIQKTIRDEKLPIKMRPELTGKASVWGSLDELLDMAAQVPGIEPCIDWSHLHARSGGKFNTHDEFRSVLKTYESVLGKAGLHDMHMHMGGIEYTHAGERNHLPIRESDTNYKDLMRTFKEFDVRGVLVAETPLLEEDTLLLKRAYRRLK